MPMTAKIAVLALLLAGCEAHRICDNHCKVEGWGSGYSTYVQDQCMCQSREYLYRIMKGYPSYVCTKQPKPADEGTDR